MLIYYKTLWITFNPLPHEQVLDSSKFKTFEDDSLIEAQLMELYLKEYNTLWEKKKMLVTSIFFFPTMFQKVVSLGLLKLGIQWERVKLTTNI